MADRALAESIVFTPAEKVVLAEQTKRLRVELAGLLADLESNSPTPSVEIMEQWMKCHAPFDYLGDMMSRKINAALYDTMFKEER